MKTLSYTQEYFMCAISSKGNVPILDVVFSTCLLAGGIMELLYHGYIVRTPKGKLVISKPWDEGLPYLKPLYETILGFKKPKDAKGVASVYLAGFSQKTFKELFSAFGASLAEFGYADELWKQGLLNKKIRYVPKPEAVTRIIEKIRAEFLEDGTISEETLYLAALLDNGKLIRNYFSKVEAEILKKRIKEVRKNEAYVLADEMVKFIYSSGYL